MKRSSLLLVTALLLLQSLFPNLVFGQNYPLKLSTNGRHLVDQDGKPFLINGDTPWLLIQKLTLDEIKVYLNNRAAKKFNTIQIMMNDYNTPVNDLNREGNRPFGNQNDFATVNEAYFLFVDKVITEARIRGIGIIMAPLWRDCCSEGWRTALNANGVTKSRQFGEYLGTRYGRANHPNFIGWMMGGDRALDDTYDDYKAVAEGIKAKDPGTFLTYHQNPGGKSTDVVSDSWLNLNSTYTYGDVYPVSYDAYARTPVMPFYLSESLYEGLLQNNSQDNATPSRVRKQAYWSILSGSAGHIYGTDAWDVQSNWKDFLDLPGAFDLSYMYTFFTGLEWEKLVPDRSHTLVTGGYGTYGNGDYATAGLTSDGKVGVAYLPSTGTGTRTLTVDMGKLTGSVTAKWFNPNTGVYTTIGSYANSGSRSFTTSGNNGDNSNDWILILDARTGTTTLRDPENPANTAAGLDYKYYEGTWSVLPTFSSLTAVESGTVTGFDLSVRNRNDNFAFSYTGFVNIPADGTYTFYTSSDDGSKLYIGTTQVVSNDGLHGIQERSGTTGLKAGKHAITVTFFEQGGGESLSVSYASAAIAKTLLPAATLFRATTAAAGFSGDYSVLAKHSGKAMEVAGASTADGGNVQQNTYSGATNQVWTIQAVGAYYRLTAKHSGKVLDVSGGVTATGNQANIQQWTNFGAGNQLWSIEAVADGYYKIIARHSGKCVDVSGPSTADGANIHQWTYGGADNQLWRFNVVATSASRAAVDLEEKVSEAAVMVYPVPVSGSALQVNFYSESNQRLQLELTSADGGRVKSFTKGVGRGLNNFTVSVSGLKNGVYLLNIQSAGKRTLRKVVIAR